MSKKILRLLPLLFLNISVADNINLQAIIDNSDDILLVEVAQAKILDKCTTRPNCNYYQGVGQFLSYDHKGEIEFLSECKLAIDKKYLIFIEKIKQNNLVSYCFPVLNPNESSSKFIGTEKEKLIIYDFEYFMIDLPGSIKLRSLEYDICPDNDSCYVHKKESYFHFDEFKRLLN